MRGFHFNQAALEANRRGQITEQQRKWVLKREQWHLALAFIFWFGLIGIGCMLAGLIFIASTINQQTRPTEVYGIFFVVLIGILALLLVVIVLYIPKHQMYRDLKAGEVLAIRGLTIVNLNEKSSSSLIVNKLQLKAPRGGLLRVKHLEPHIVYYLPRSKVVASVEVVEES